MWLTARHLSIHPAIVTARLGQITRWPFRRTPDSLTQLDKHLLRDIGIEPAQARSPQPQNGDHDGSSGDRVAATLGRAETSSNQRMRLGSVSISSWPSGVSRR